MVEIYRAPDHRRRVLLVVPFVLFGLASFARHEPVLSAALALAFIPILFLRLRNFRRPVVELDHPDAFVFRGRLARPPATIDRSRVDGWRIRPETSELVLLLDDGRFSYLLSEITEADVSRLTSALLELGVPEVPFP